MKNHTSEKELENQSHEDDTSATLDVQEFPPRSEAHRRKDKRKSRVQKKKKKKMIRFPLVRILLILFLFLVAAMVTYPIWIQRL
ncbi:hypothetical protein [Salipaludibacillus neizhouensis]|uniref:hypothetical protein n=1 Tax=Salipaludibacillus neizhouensis TaxID=885475 RepID=UPI00167D5924|nr:hypothetical protein [Salipaludibacillus neizhouensis]